MLDDLTQRVQSLVEGKDALGFDIKFDLEDDGVIHVAGSEAPMQVTNEDKPAATTFNVSAADLEAMMKGELQPMNAFMTGRLKVDGDMGKAMQVGSLFN